MSSNAPAIRVPTQALEMPIASNALRLMVSTVNLSNAVLIKAPNNPTLMATIAADFSPNIFLNPPSIDLLVLHAREKAVTESARLKHVAPIKTLAGYGSSLNPICKPNDISHTPCLYGL